MTNTPSAGLGVLVLALCLSTRFLLIYIKAVVPVCVLSVISSVGLLRGLVIDHSSVGTVAGLMPFLPVVNSQSTTQSMQTANQTIAGTGANSTMTSAPNSTLSGAPNSTLSGAPNSTLTSAPNGTLSSATNTLSGLTNQTMSSGSGVSFSSTAVVFLIPAAVASALLHL